MISLHVTHAPSQPLQCEHMKKVQVFECIRILVSVGEKSSLPVSNEQSNLHRDSWANPSSHEQFPHTWEGYSDRVSAGRHRSSSVTAERPAAPHPRPRGTLCLQQITGRLVFLFVCCRPGCLLSYCCSAVDSLHLFYGDSEPVCSRLTCRSF